MADNPENRAYLRISPAGGESIEEFAGRMCVTAAHHRRIVTGEFNGVELTTTPHTHVIETIAFFKKAFREQREFREKTDSLADLFSLRSACKKQLEAAEERLFQALKDEPMRSEEESGRDLSGEELLRDIRSRLMRTEEKLDRLLADKSAPLFPATKFPNAPIGHTSEPTT
jgi:hypothetical protein